MLGKYSAGATVQVLPAWRSERHLVHTKTQRHEVIDSRLLKGTPPSSPSERSSVLPGDGRCTDSTQPRGVAVFIPSPLLPPSPHRFALGRGGMERGGLRRRPSAAAANPPFSPSPLPPPEASGRGEGAGGRVRAIRGQGQALPLRPWSGGVAGNRNQMSNHLWIRSFQNTRLNKVSSPVYRLRAGFVMPEDSPS